MLCTRVSAYSHAQSVKWSVRCYVVNMLRTIFYCHVRLQPIDIATGRRKEAYSITFRNWWTNGQLRDLLKAIVKDKWRGSDYIIEPWRC